MFLKKGCKPCPEFGILVLRLVIGGTFVMHGGQKLFGLFGGNGVAEFGRSLQYLQIPMPQIMAYVVGGTEFFGGILLILGLFTQCAAALLSVVMLVAIFKVHWGAGFFSPRGFEFPLVLLAGCVCLMTTGCLKWGLDCMGFVKNLCCKK